MFLLISITSSIIFLGCHAITSYSADPKQFINRPIIMHRKPWLGTIAGITSILVFITLPINGWFIAKWLGVFSLPIFWFAATNPTISFLLKYPSSIRKCNDFIVHARKLALLVPILQHLTRVLKSTVENSKMGCLNKPFSSIKNLFLEVKRCTSWLNVAYEKGKKYLLIRNPFIQVMFGGTAWIILTILNLIIL